VTLGCHSLFLPWGMEGNVTIAAFDVETTGRNPLEDQVIEISIVRSSGVGFWEALEAGRTAESYCKRIRPSVDVSPGAQAVHGISQEDLDQELPFSDFAEGIEQIIMSADILMGYNVSFDIRFLEQEFKRLGLDLDLSKKLVVDPLRIWHSMEPRKLENAYERFVGGELGGAHAADADTKAVLEVLHGMKSSFKLESATPENLAELTSPDRALWVGSSRHVRWEGGLIVIGFGKYEGRPLYHVAQEDADYIRWIRDSEFPKHVHSLCKGAVSGITEEEFIARVISFSPPPSSETAPAVKNGPQDQLA
jgi:DNA polymerase-3 subunit epsilon